MKDLKILLFQKKEYVYILVFLVLILMGVVMIGSLKDNNSVVDEQLFLSTGYMFLTERTMFFGFEHPPLVRYLAALPLLSLNLRPASEFFVTTLSQSPLSNMRGVSQWNFADDFLFNQIYSPDEILFISRLVMVVITLSFGFLVFKWTSLVWGNGPGFLALGLFSLSPLILAHGQIVNMDVASALGIFASVYYFVKFLQKPDLKRILIISVVFGLTQLTKASALLLIPYFFILFFFWVIINRPAGDKNVIFFVNQIKRYFLKLLLIAILVILIIIFVYQVCMTCYPKEQQGADIRAVLIAQRPELYQKISWLPRLALIPILRNLAQYAFGAIWQYTRNMNFSYFNGQGSSEAFPLYFPIGYFIKEPLAFHILTFLGLWFVVKRIKRKKSEFLKNNFFVVASFFWIIFYWLMLVKFSTINSGIRYLIPTLPFIYFLIAGGVGWWLNQRQNIFSFKHAFVGGLMAWQMVSVLSVYPFFLPYFNELVGGPAEGYRYLADVDVDWGQGIKRLGEWVKANGIEQISVLSRFVVKYEEGGEYAEYFVYNRNYQYYLGSKLRYLSSDTPVKGWVAIPVHLLQWGTAEPSRRYGWSSNSYDWLKDYEPVTKIGHSIFVYYIN